MMNWFKKEQAPLVEIKEVPNAILSPCLAWRIGLLGRRLQHLAAHALNTEKSFSANLI